MLLKPYFRTIWIGFVVLESYVHLDWLHEVVGHATTKIGKKGDKHNSDRRIMDFSLTIIFYGELSVSHCSRWSKIRPTFNHFIESGRLHLCRHYRQLKPCVHFKQVEFNKFILYCVFVAINRHTNRYIWSTNEIWSATYQKCLHRSTALL